MLDSTEPTASAAPLALSNFVDCSDFLDFTGFAADLQDMSVGCTLHRKSLMNLRLVCVTMTTLALAALSSGCCCMDRYYHGDCQRPAMWGRNMGPGCASGTCAS